MFAGYAELDATFVGLMVARGAAELPQEPDAPPSFRVYGPGGLMTGGTGTTTKLGDDPGIYRYAIAASGSLGYELGEIYRVLFDYSVGGDAFAAEQTFLVG